MKSADPSQICCPLCSDRKFNLYQKVDDVYSIWRCRSCDFIFVNPLPDQHALQEHYDEEVYYQQWIKSELPERHRLWQRRLKTIQPYQPSGKLLDIGCGLGTFLYEAGQQGYDGVGVELSHYGAQFARDHFHLNVHQGDVQSAGFVDNTFDMITLWHVLEHVLEPASFIQHIKGLLKPGGVLVVAVPNVDCHIMRFVYPLIRGKQLALFDPQDKEIHLGHYNVQSLTHFLSNQGFTIEHADLDLGQVSWSKRLLDYVAWTWGKLTNQKVGMAIKVIARKI